MTKIPLYASKTDLEDDDLFIMEDSATNTTKKVKKSDMFKVPATVTVTATASSIAPTTAKTFITALAGNLTINDINAALKIDGQPIIIRIKDNGTQRTLTINSAYRFVGVTKPTTTTVNKVLYLGGFYNESATKIDIVAVARES